MISVVCQQFNRTNPNRFGVTELGETADGNGFCRYGFGSAMGGVVYCTYVSLSVAALGLSISS